MPLRKPTASVGWRAEYLIFKVEAVLLHVANACAGWHRYLLGSGLVQASIGKQRFDRNQAIEFANTSSPGQLYRG